MKKLVITLIIVLVCTSVFAVDYSRKDVPEELVAKLDNYADILLDRYEKSKEAEASESFLAGEYTVAENIVTEYRKTIDKYRANNGKDQKWGTHKVVL